MPDTAKTIETQRYIKSVFDNKDKADLIQRLTRLNGVEDYKNELKAALS